MRWRTDAARLARHQSTMPPDVSRWPWEAVLLGVALELVAVAVGLLLPLSRAGGYKPFSTLPPGMTDTAVQAALEDDYETELSRLGSSKSLYALTEGEMEPEAVRGALAAWAATAADAFEAWADDADRDGVFADAADTARDLAERTGEPDGANDPAGQVTEVLAVQSDVDARLGALLAWTMVTDRTLSQAVGFFVGSADTSSADLMRDLRTAVDDLRESVLDRLAGADEKEARTAAEQVVEAAYDGYVQRLEGMGVKVKPVC